MSTKNILVIVFCAAVLIGGVTLYQHFKSPVVIDRATMPVVTSPTPSATPIPLSSPTPTPLTSTPTPTSKPSSIPTPVDNDDPSVRLITSGIEDAALPNTRPVYLSAEIKDNVGGIAKVDLYVNGHKEATASRRNTYARSASGWDADVADKATEKTASYIISRYSEKSGNVGYAYRSYFKATNTPMPDCDVKEGYLLIMQGDKYLYDVRVSKDLSKLDVCYKGDTINYDDIYTFLYFGEKGDYRYYFKAFDTLGASAKSREVKFTLD